MSKNRETARATLENLYRIFTVPEAPDSTLGSIDRAISRDVTGFLQTHIVALERSLEEIEADFSSSVIPEEPTFVSEYTDFVKEKLVAQSVHTAAPGFIGHMTSSLPYFMLPLSRIMTALNQNLVKVETSKAFTPLERQVLALVKAVLSDEIDPDAKPTRVHELDPDLVQAWVNLGGALLMKWDFKGCLEANREAVRRQDDLAPMKFLIPEGDKIAQLATRAMGVNPVSLPISQIRASLIN